MLFTASNEMTKRSQEVVATGEGALRTDPSGSRYQDLGLVIDVTNVAAGAIVWSDYVENVQWVRNLVIMIKCDQQHRVPIVSQDTRGVSSSEQHAYYDTLVSSFAGTGNTFQLHRAGTSAASAGFLGYSAKFGVRNDSSSQASYAQLRIQLLGL